MNNTIHEIEPPFKFLYEDDETQVLVQTKTYDLTFVLIEFVNFLQGCNYEKEAILEELKRFVNKS